MTVNKLSVQAVSDNFRFEKKIHLIFLSNKTRLSMIKNRWKMETSQMNITNLYKII